MFWGAAIGLGVADKPEASANATTAGDRAQAHT
jgi:hypothetical protein